jgi:hypothetical protein
MGVDLLELVHTDILEYRTIRIGLERTSRLLRELQEYFFPTECFPSTRNFSEVLSESVREVERGEDFSGKAIRVICSESLPALRLNWLCLGRALERVVRSACGLCSAGDGEIVVEAKSLEGSGDESIEVTVQIWGIEDLGMEEEAIFTPFLRVNGYQLGMSLVLARRAIGCCRGQLTFCKTDAQRAQFSILVKNHQGR